MAATPLLGLVRDAAVTARPEETRRAVTARLAARGLRQAFVLDAGGALLGVFSPGAGDPEAPVGKAAKPPALMLDDGLSLAEALERLRGFVGDAAPVTARADGRFLGAVAEADLISAWLDDARRSREEENAAL